ncbi:MAG: peptidoglycan editing factor PgeF [Bacteroidaceae bacterium]|nr:peptidoglycan editing factor PgeF [Bacteroidaceae bacterium]
MNDFLMTYPFPEEVTAFSTLRCGGVSEGPYASMNANPFCGDRPEHVAENRRRLAKALDISPDRFVIPHQNHGTQTVFVSEPVELEGVDALVTQETELCICVSTADCMPILLYDPVHRAVAAVHSGWRGTAKRIVEHVLQAMHDRIGTRPQDVQACVGPAILLEAFEVGDEVYEAFEQAGFPMDVIARRKEKWHIDLERANMWLLGELGVGRATPCGLCTYSMPHTFFSARRDGRKSGRILNGIILRR